MFPATLKSGGGVHFLIYRVRQYNAMIMKATERCCLTSLIFFIDKFVLAYQTILNVQRPY